MATLDPDQEAAISYIIANPKCPVLIHGRAQTGKSHIWRTHLCRRIDAAVFSSTREGLEMVPDGITIQALCRQCYNTNNGDWTKTAIRKYYKKTLYIDDIQTLSAQDLNQFDISLRGMFGSTEPFGGARIVFIYDPYGQLPPQKAFNASRLFFNGRAFKSIAASLKKIHLTQSHRPGIDRDESVKLMDDFIIPLQSGGRVDVEFFNHVLRRRRPPPHAVRIYANAKDAQTALSKLTNKFTGTITATPMMIKFDTANPRVWVDCSGYTSTPINRFGTLVCTPSNVIALPGKPLLVQLDGDSTSTTIVPIERDGAWQYPLQTGYVRNVRGLTGLSLQTPLVIMSPIHAHVVMNRIATIDNLYFSPNITAHQLGYRIHTEIVKFNRLL